MKYFLLCIMMLALTACKKDKHADNKTAVLPPLNIPADSVKLNPYGFAPLSALLTYNSPTPGHTRIVVKGQGGSADIIQEFSDGGMSHTIPILGLYPSYNNQVEVYLLNDKAKEVAMTTMHIQTGDLPAGMPIYLNVDNADYANMEPGLNLVSNFSASNPYIPYIVDGYGKIRWYLDFANFPVLNKLTYDCGVSRLKNGNFYFADVTSGQIYEVDVLGKIIHTWSFPGYDFHHDVTEMPNGNFLMTANKHGSTNSQGTPTIEDYVLEIDRNTNKILTEWDLKQSLDAYRRTLSNDAQDWMHGNAVIYDPNDQTIIVSGRVQGVVKLTFDNRVKWILAPHKGWGLNGRNEDLNKFLLTPLDGSGNKITDTTLLAGYVNAEGFEWTWYQHSPVIMPNGNLLLFDNGSTRNYNDSQGHYSRAVVFDIDPVNMTVKQVWDYGKDRGLETYSVVISSVKYLPGKDHILFGPGFMVSNTVGKGGKVVEIDYKTKKVVFQMSVSTASGWSFHRVQRLPLYANSDSYHP